MSIYISMGSFQNLYEDGIESLLQLFYLPVALVVAHGTQYSILGFQNSLSYHYLS